MNKICLAILGSLVAVYCSASLAATCTGSQSNGGSGKNDKSTCNSVYMNNTCSDMTCPSTGCGTQCKWVNNSCTQQGGDCDLP